MSTVASRVDPTAVAAEFLPGADYADAFRVGVAAGRPAREWAVGCLGTGVSIADRAFGGLVWHGVLGFDLAPRDAPGTLVGWGVTVDEPELFVMRVDGRLMAGCIVFEVYGGAVVWTTLLRFHRPPATQIWAVAQHLHRPLARLLLGRAARLPARAVAA